MRDFQAEILEGKIEPTNLELLGKEDAFMELFQGKPLASAWVNGLIKIKGVRNNLLKAMVIGMILSV